MPQVYSQLVPPPSQLNILAESRANLANKRQEEQMKLNKMAEQRAQQSALQQAMMNQHQMGLDRQNMALQKQGIHDEKLAKSNQLLMQGLYSTYQGLEKQGIKDPKQRAAIYGKIMQQGKQRGLMVTPEHLKAISTPEGLKAMETKFAGMLSEKEKERQSGSEKYRDIWMHPETGHAYETIRSGGRTLDAATMKPISISELSKKGYRSQSLAEKYDQTAQGQAAKYTATIVEDANSAVKTARVFKDQAQVFKRGLDKLTDSDFGPVAGPKMVAQKLGLLVNDLAGTEVVDINNEGLGIKEVLNALSTQGALTMTAQTKGAISEMEMNLFLNAVPKLSQSKAGYQAIIAGFEAIAQRAVDVQKFIAKERKANGGVVPRDIDVRITTEFFNKPTYSESVMAALEDPDSVVTEPGTSTRSVKLGPGLVAPDAQVPKELPQGSKQVGTFKGNPVYESPDGKRWVIE